MDSLVESLSKFTALLNPAMPRTAVAFGENEKARSATQTFFAIANRCRPEHTCSLQDKIVYTQCIADGVSHAKPARLLPHVSGKILNFCGLSVLFGLHFGVIKIIVTFCSPVNRTCPASSVIVLHTHMGNSCLPRCVRVCWLPVAGFCAFAHKYISHCLLLTACNRGGDGLRCGGALAHEHSAASLGPCRCSFVS